MLMKILLASQACVNHAYKSIFKFGIIADIQYVDADDGTNFAGNKIRRYRQSLRTLKHAILSWNSLEEPIKCAISLGDTLDGQVASKNIQQKCFLDVKQACMELNSPFHFCFGNHDYYSFNRDEIYDRFIPTFQKPGATSSLHPFSVGGYCAPSKLYYDFSPYPGYRFVLLDCYDVSLIGAADENSRDMAKILLKENNPNDLSVPGTWFHNLPREKFRWVPYNGGIGKAQLAWLNRVLDQSSAQEEKVFIFCHQPIFSPFQPNALVWNSEEVLGLLHKYDNICMWMAGHDHEGQYHIDNHGVHHLIPPAPLECAENEVAFGHIEVCSDRLLLHWSGKVPKKSLYEWPVEMVISRRAGRRQDN